jgi:galactoside O-acetyltransferase
MFYKENELVKLNIKKIGRKVKLDSSVILHNPELIEIGDFSRIDANVILSGKIVIGNNVHIAVNSFLNGGEKGIFLEDFSGLAYGVYVFTSSDDYSGESLTNPTIPIKFKKTTEKLIVIQKHVIVGTKSIIFPGVILSEGCAIGAMSLVNKSTDPWKIYFGIPARQIGERKKTLLELEKQYLKQLI